MSRLIVIAVICLVASGCAVVPQGIAERVRSDFAGNQPCQELFLTTDGIYAKSYQKNAAQVFAVFTIARDLQGAVKVCTWNSAGWARGWEYIENATLSSCEKSRLSYMDKNNEELQPCEVYARNNEIR